MAAIIELISSIVEISGNPVVDTILFAIIGLISFSVAFGLVGFIFDGLGFYDSDLMSDTHWVIRVIVFAGLTWFFVKVFQFFAWLLSFQWWVYVIAGVVIVIIVAVVYYINYKRNFQKNTVVESNEKFEGYTESKVDIKPININVYEKYKCPRCGSKIVIRHGPYGEFVGCSSFPKCNYSRKRF